MSLIVTKIEPIRRDITLMVDRTLSKETQQKLFVAASRVILDDVEAKNLAALGQPIEHKTFVDGVRSEAIDNAQKNIVRAYDLVSDLLVVALDELEMHSPRRSGRYANSHVLFADGVEVDDPRNPPPAREYVVMNLQAYARKIEGTEHSGGKRAPQSRQAPDGVYNVVADLLRGRFGKIAQIRFSYRTAIGGSILSGGNADRNPCIVIGPR